MGVMGILASIFVIILVLIDGFETILQPRRVMHRWRYARLFYRSTWRVWRAAALLIGPGKRREAFLSIFGPLSLLGLFATWVAGLIFGFAHDGNRAIAAGSECFAGLGIKRHAVAARADGQC